MGKLYRFARFIYRLLDKRGGGHPLSFEHGEPDTEPCHTSMKVR